MSTEPLPDCRWTSTTTPRVLPGRHGGECPGTDATPCAGCQPCPRDHCPNCARRHSASICPGCLGDARTDLNEIGNLHDHLPGQTVDGSNANGRLLAQAPIPGGDALVLLAPGADVPTDVPTDPLPTLLVLATWEDALRPELDCGPGPRATVWRCVDWLTEHLHELADPAHPHRADLFVELARDLRTARGALESVLGAGVRDATTVACIAVDCTGELRQVSTTPNRCTHDTPARRDVARWLDLGYPEAVSAPMRRALLEPCRRTGCDQGGRRDRWSCTRCSRTYSEAEYRRAVAQDASEAQPIRPGVEIAQALSIPPARIRLWASRGTIERHGRDARGRVLYDIREVRRRVMAGGLVIEAVT